MLQTAIHISFSENLVAHISSLLLECQPEALREAKSPTASLARSMFDCSPTTIKETAVRKSSPYVA